MSEIEFEIEFELKFEIEFKFDIKIEIKFKFKAAVKTVFSFLSKFEFKLLTNPCTESIIQIFDLKTKRILKFFHFSFFNFITKTEKGKNFLKFIF